MAFPLPEHIANKLAEQTFENFDDFSQAFWLAIAEDPHLPPPNHPLPAQPHQTGLASPRALP